MAPGKLHSYLYIVIMPIALTVVAGGHEQVHGPITMS